MKFTSTKQTLIGFTVFLTIFLGSCGVAEDTAPPGPQPDYMSFALTNLGGGPLVNPTNELSRGDTYRLTITPTNGTTIPTADYTINHTPLTAITINVTRTNSIDFTVNNTADTTLTITVTHKTDSSVRESVTLTLGPQSPNMSFTLTNRSGATVGLTAQLSSGSTYGLVITPGSGVVPATADYVVTHTPVAAITTNVIRTNSVDFTVNNITDRAVTFTVTHRTVSAISETITLNLASQVDYMSFALTNRSGTPVTTTTQLFRGSTYGLVITPGSGVVPATADYTITYTPATAITTNVVRPNSVDFTVNNTTDISVTVTVAHRTVSAIRETVILNFMPQIVTTFQQNIENATTVPNLIIANALTRAVLEPLNVATGTTLVKRYVTQTGGATTRDGTSWATAWAAANLRANINAISDATANRVYLVMIAGGTYKPTTTTSRGDSFSMKNHVAIMGGFDPAGGWGRTGTTVFSGDIGVVGNNGDNSYHVFFHNSITLGNAHLYGVTIINGNANGSFPDNSGGGMYNNSSSPVLTSVVFSENTTIGLGGGMFNNGASPVLTSVVFSDNNSANNGGGIYNDSSSPVLTRVVFIGNSVNNGGGMYNFGSSPVLTSVVFSGNTATSIGGGMFNFSSSPVMIGTVFRNNSAADGGGMYNDNGGQPGPLIVNSIFSGNNVTGSGGATGNGPDIAMNLVGGGSETIRIAGSVLGIGGGSAITGIVGYNGGVALNITHHSLANGAVRFGADATLTINGMNFTYPTITTGSSAINRGLYVRRNGGTYYFSETEAVTSWHTGFTSTGGLDGTAAALPTTGTIEDLTATDIAGNTRSGRPDAGVYELP